MRCCRWRACWLRGLIVRREAVLELLRQIEDGKATPEAAMERLASLPFEDLGFAKLDHHRSLRSGMPEVIFAAGKTPQQVAGIFAALAASGISVLATRANEEHAAAVRQVLPEAAFHAQAGCLTLVQNAPEPAGHVAVVCAGTSDLPVAEEAALTAEIFGARVTRLSDVGVAGMHRVLAHLEMLRAADVVVACAGMEGALASVMGGLVEAPVIAVPTSVGYGAAFEGVAALLGMLNACSPNVTVVNIDNGFGAGYVATLIARGPRKR